MDLSDDVFMRYGSVVPLITPHQDNSAYDKTQKTNGQKHCLEPPNVVGGKVEREINEHLKERSPSLHPMRGMQALKTPVESYSQKDQPSRPLRAANHDTLRRRMVLQPVPSGWNRAARERGGLAVCIMG